VLSVSPDLMSVERLFEFRNLLEVDAARLAALRASPEQITVIEELLVSYRPVPDSEPDWQSFAAVDDALHAEIAKAAGNPYLTVMVESVRELMQDIVVLIADHPGSIEEAMRHHCRIVAAIAKRDPALAASEMAAHVGYTAGVVQLQASSSNGDTSMPDRIATPH
jgi:DNA-binding FadR family transcriptional regulator